MSTLLDASSSSAAAPDLSPAEYDRFLDQLPSETTPGERRLLFDLFRRDWDGSGTVVEIGPFLGGTTRAIAGGMMRHPRFDPATAALHTFDRFDAYYSPERLRSTIEPLVRDGTFTAARADELCRTAGFAGLFDAIHQPHDYGRLIHLHDSPLPDYPEDLDGSTSLDRLLPLAPFSALFIDGCKSWASTVYAMQFLLPHTRPGAPVIFQDFGWYTCFWISSAVHALRDLLSWETHVDATYVFRLTRAASAAEISTRLARTPHAMGEAFFQTASAALLERSRQAGDLRGELIAQLHLVAALVTIGRKPAAAEILKRLDVRRYAADADLIRGALQSPTYLPGGKKLTWQSAA